MRAIYRPILGAGLFFCAAGGAARAAGLTLAAAPPPAPVPFDLAAHASGAEPAQSVSLGLSDCLARTLEGNLGLQIQRVDPALREADLRTARAAFEPSLKAAASLADSAERSASIMSTNRSTSRSINASVGVDGRLPIGTHYTLEFLADKLKSSSTFQTINPYYHVNPRIALTQPLFRGAGPAANRAELLIARINAAVSRIQLEEAAMDAVSRTVEAYYGLYHARARHALAQDALERIRNLLEINRKRYAKGLASSVEVLEAEASEAEHRKGVIAAESAMRDAEDQLKQAANLVDDPLLWQARIELLDEPDPPAGEPSLPDSLQRAFARRPDYRALKQSLTVRDIQIRLARNTRLPTLDLVGSFGLNGLDQSLGKAVDSLGPDYKDWMIGLRLTVPWGGAERARVDQRQWEKVQALLELKQLEQTILLDIRRCLRDLDTQARHEEAARLASDLAAKHYAIQEERYAGGQVSTHDMLDYQNRLAFARQDHVKSRIDCQIARVRLDQAEGGTLARYNIILEP